MDAKDVSKVLTDLGLDHYPDGCNPDFTIHLHDSRLWSYTLIDTIFENGPWTITPMDRTFTSDDLETPEELIAELKVRGYLGGRETVVGENGE